MKVYGLKHCTTTQKVMKFLSEHGLTMPEVIDIREQPPLKEEIALALNQADGNPRKILNTSGELYRSTGLKDRVDEMSAEELVDLLSQEGMLIKRPFIVSGEQVSSGSNEKMLTEIWLKK